MSLTVLDKPIRILSQSLYIEPTSVCNLHCKMCYTNVINGPDRRVVPAETMITFVRRFLEVTPTPVSVYWCGTGEVFLHRDFPKVLNELMTEYGDDVLTHTVQTNGTIRRLDEFGCLERIDFRVSIDGSREFH